MAIKVIDPKGVGYTCDEGVITLKQGEIISEKLIGKEFTERGLLHLQEQKRIDGFSPSKALLKALEDEESALEISRIKGEERMAKKADYKADRLARQEARLKARQEKLRTGHKPAKEDSFVKDEPKKEEENTKKKGRPKKS